MDRKTPLDPLEAAKRLEDLGKTTLMDGHKENILMAFNKYPDNWYDVKILSEVLGVSKEYAYKVCEAFTLTRLVEKRKAGNSTFYRYRKEERLGK